MRRDIQVNTAINDIVLTDQNTVNTYPFEWTSEDDLFLLGTITLPSDFDISKLNTVGVKVMIPYTPIYKPMKFRIARNFGEGYQRPVINPVDNGEWFEARTKLYNMQQKTLYASQLIMISVDYYIVQICDGVVYLWSNALSDMNNIGANIQNRNLLLQCIPSNNYRYPTSGVGLVRYLHSNLSHSGLADKLQKEFQADKVKVNNAAFNSFTGDLDLDLDFSEADAGI